MKNIFTILIALLFVSAFGQEKPVQMENQSRFAVRTGLFSDYQGLKADKEQPTKKGKARLDQIKSMQQFMTDEIWELESMVYDEYWKTGFSYDVSGNNTERIEYEWIDTKADWEKVWREQWIYDDAGLVTLIQEYEWDPVSEQWVLGWKTEFTYEDNIITLIFFYLDGNNWLLTFKEVIELDQNEHIAFYTAYYWDEFQGEWLPDWLEEYAYDELNRLILFVNYYYYEFSREWTPDYKMEITYTGNTSESLGYVWYDEWILSLKFEYLLDDYGDMVEEIYYIWDEDEEEWMVVDKLIYAYNYAYSIDNLIVPQIYEFKHMLTQGTNYYWTGGMWVEDISFEVKWKDTSTGLVSVNDPLIRIYPNPAANHFNINVNSTNNGYIFELYDLGGSLLKSYQLKGDAKLPTLDLESGMYMYRILLDGKLLTGKVLVK